MNSDYYPYGMQMPGRHTNDPNYRYGYNGMEKDAEMHGEGNSYTTEFRQYDPRLGRWLSLDPLMMKYPGMSPYVAFNDNPVYFTDPLGLESVDPEGEPEFKEPNPDAGSEYADGAGYGVDLPSESDLMGTAGNTQKGVWNKRTYRLMQGDAEYAKITRDIMKMARRMEKTAKDKWNLTSYNNFNVTFEMASETDYTYSLSMNYKTSKGNLVRITIPLYTYSPPIDPLDENSKPTITKLDWFDITNGGTNCHAHALGLPGHLPNPSQILKDDYRLSSKRKVGDVGYFKYGDHSVKIIGKNKKGEFIYSSNWMGGNVVEGTWDELVNGQFLDYGLRFYISEQTETTEEKTRDIRESDFIWYEKK